MIGMKKKMGGVIWSGGKVHFMVYFAWLDEIQPTMMLATWLWTEVFKSGTDGGKFR